MNVKLDAALALRIANDPGLWRDFNDICDTGGRLAGTASEKKAFALLRERVQAASPTNAGRSLPVAYGGWRAKRASLRKVGGRELACQDRKSTRLNSSHVSESRMPSSA